MTQDEQPEIPESYADLVEAMIDTNSGTLKPPREEAPRGPEPARTGFPARADLACEALPS